MATPELPFWAQILSTLALVTALGPLHYRIAYQPIAEASVLVLLIVSVAVHFALTGLGLWFFGAEGSRTPPFSSGSIEIGVVTIREYSNENEYAVSEPMTAILPCCPSQWTQNYDDGKDTNPSVVLDCLRVLNDNWNGEGWQAFDNLWNCPTLWRRTIQKINEQGNSIDVDVWETEEEIKAAQKEANNA